MSNTNIIEKVGHRTPCFIIADLVIKNNDSLALATETIKAAKRAGADAIKLQMCLADAIAFDSHVMDFKISDDFLGAQWNGPFLCERHEQISKSRQWYAQLSEIAREQELLCFSSVCDISSVAFLESLNNSIYKISSFEITDIPLIRFIAQLNKPMMIATGIATYEDIALAIKTCHEVGNHQITLLKCTAAYPASMKEIHLIMMQQFAKDFNVKVGLSDQTSGAELPLLSVILGAQIIEKQLILNRNPNDFNVTCAIDEQQFKQMVVEIRAIERQALDHSEMELLVNFLDEDSPLQGAIGRVSYDLTKKQLEARRFCRSLYVMQSINKNELFTKENLRTVRSHLGLPPKFLDELLGQKANKDLTVGIAMSYDFVADPSDKILHS